MPGESTVLNMLVDYGALALFAVLFYILFKWVLKYFETQKNEYIKIISESAEREKNYQEIISKLSNELPDMRETLSRIESKIT